MKKITEENCRNRIIAIGIGQVLFGIGIVMACAEQIFAEILLH